VPVDTNGDGKYDRVIHFVMANTWRTITLQIYDRGGTTVATTIPEFGTADHGERVPDHR